MKFMNSLLSLLKWTVSDYLLLISISNRLSLRYNRPSNSIGTQGKPAVAILSCILARQLCFEDPSCSAILEIIPRVCGPVPGM